MKRLGYTRFVAPGGDWGAIVVDEMAVLAPPELLGIHTNMAGVVPAEIHRARLQHPRRRLSAALRSVRRREPHLRPAGLLLHPRRRLRSRNGHPSADPLRDCRLADRARRLDAQPRRASYADVTAAVVDNPVGNLTRDEILDNLTFTWLTNTGVSSTRLYWENTLRFFDVKGVTIPVAVSVFPHEIYPAPRSWAERAYPHLIYFNALDHGCHFAAWQEPALFRTNSAPPSGPCGRPPAFTPGRRGRVAGVDPPGPAEPHNNLRTVIREPGQRPGTYPGAIAGAGRDAGYEQRPHGRKERGDPGPLRQL